MKLPNRHRKGFALIEMVIVIALIGALMYIIIPTDDPTESVIKLELIKDYQSIGIALQGYRNRHGDYPATQLGLEVLYEQVPGAPDNWYRQIRKRKNITGRINRCTTMSTPLADFPRCSI